MRIIAGAWRGRTIEAPEGRGTRPTSDRAREGLFSMLQSRLGTFEGLRVADLFAGTGALGLEALSRGAAHCTFVEKSPEPLLILKKNVAKLGAESRAEILNQSIGTASRPSLPFDLVLMDPPYGHGLAERGLQLVAGEGWLAPGALISVEADRALDTVPPCFEADAERSYGKARVTLFRKIG